jgi:hypothetical protein
LHPLNDRRQCLAGRALIGFAKPDILYSPIRIQRRLRRLPLYDDANENLQVSLLDSLSDGDCKRSRETELRMSDGFFRFQAKTTSARKI